MHCTPARDRRTLSNSSHGRMSGTSRFVSSQRKCSTFSSANASRPLSVQLNESELGDPIADGVKPTSNAIASGGLVTLFKVGCWIDRVMPHLKRNRCQSAQRRKFDRKQRVSMELRNEPREAEKSARGHCGSPILPVTFPKQCRDDRLCSERPYWPLSDH
jgi:hypothetical protein